MAKSKVIENISVDKKFVGNLIAEHGIIMALKHMEKLFGCNANENIEDPTLRIMVWQITHSISTLEKKTGKTYSDIMFIKHIGQATDDASVSIICEHIQSATDSLKAYIKI